MFREGGEKDLLGLCIRFPTINPRVSSIKSQDQDPKAKVILDDVSKTTKAYKIFKIN